MILADKKKVRFFSLIQVVEENGKKDCTARKMNYEK